MSEKIKQTFDTDDPTEGDEEVSEESEVMAARRLGPRYVDYISTRGVLRAYQQRRTRIEVAPRSSAVWDEYRIELGRRSTRLVALIDEQLSS